MLWPGYAHDYSAARICRMLPKQARSPFQPIKGKCRSFYTDTVTRLLLAHNSHNHSTPTRFDVTLDVKDLLPCAERKLTIANRYT